MTRFLRHLTLTAAAIAIASGAAAQSAPSADSDGWRTVIYPVRGWLPVFGAEVRLPEVPDIGGGATIPRAKVSGDFNGAVAAGFRVERARLSLDGSFLWAGMSGEIQAPFARLDVDTIAGRLTAGVRVLPDFFVDAGVRRLAVKLTASVLAYPVESWKPGIWESVVGVTYRPQIGRKFRILTQANVGGVGQSNHRTAELTGTAEWKPLSHIALGAGYGFLWMRADGTLRGKPVHVRQTLQGPTVTVGIPF